MAGGRKRTSLQRALGDRVRVRRQRIGLTQEELSHLAGLHNSYVGHLEAGWRNPTVTTLTRLARALRVDAGELVAGLQDVGGAESDPGSGP